MQSASTPADQWAAIVAKAPDHFCIEFVRRLHQDPGAAESSKAGSDRARAWLCDWGTERATVELVELLSSKIKDHQRFSLRWIVRYRSASAQAMLLAMRIWSDVQGMNNIESHVHWACDADTEGVEKLILQLWRPDDPADRPPMIAIMLEVEPPHNARTRLNIARLEEALSVWADVIPNGYVKLMDEMVVDVGEMPMESADGSQR